MCNVINGVFQGLEARQLGQRPRGVQASTVPVVRVGCAAGDRHAGRRIGPYSAGSIHVTDQTEIRRAPLLVLW